MCFYVCMCVHVCMGRCMCAHICVWRSEVNIEKCSCLDNTDLVGLCLFLFLFLNRILHWPRAHQVISADLPASQGDLLVFASLASGCHGAPLFHGFWVQTQVLKLACKVPRHIVLSLLFTLFLGLGTQCRCRCMQVCAGLSPCFYPCT